MKTAAARNVGPVESIQIPVPEGGGLVVFRGANGCGKTTVLNTIDAAVTGRGKVPVRDGSLKAEFDGFGVRLTIGRSTRRVGEAEVHSLEGRLNVADLVDPQIQDPEKADAHRVKALASLVGAKADPALFHALTGGPAAFDAVVSPASLTHAELIPMAAAVKRDLEAASRQAAHEAANARARADAARRMAQLPESVDADQEADAKVLQRELEQAVAAKSRLEAQHAAAGRAIASAAASKEQFERAQAAYAGPTVGLAVQEERLAAEREDAALRACEAAEAALRRAQEQAAHARNELVQKRQALAAAQQHARTLSAWQEQVEAAGRVEPVKPGDLVRAKAAVDEARERIEAAVQIRRAREQAVEAQSADATAADCQARADRLRDAARGVDDVLSGVVARAGVPLRIEPLDGRMRLTLATGRGPSTPFGDLSDGERWRLALAIAIKAVGPGGELTIPQHAYEGLDPAARVAIAEQLRAAGVIGYTAEAADGSLRAEVFHSNGSN